MKVIPVSEAKANLSRYGRLCQEEPVIVTINGIPSFQLTPVTEDDDLIDRLLVHNPKFVGMLEERKDEPTISLNEVPKTAEIVIERTAGGTIDNFPNAAKPATHQEWEAGLERELTEGSFGVWRRHGIPGRERDL